MKTSLLGVLCLGMAAGSVAWLGHPGQAPKVAGPEDVKAVERTLDKFHDAASRASEKDYFGLMADNFVFLGTDASERWKREEFRAYAKPYFDEGTGWTYVALPDRRFVTIAADGKTAWFDEALKNAKFGECRGSGVLIREDGQWLLSQYNLTVPIPNEMLNDVAKSISQLKGKGGKK